MNSTDGLLPAADDAPRCSPYTSALGLDPGGTAIFAEHLILVATPLPWPKPIRDHELLIGMMDVVGNAPLSGRLLAMHGAAGTVIRFRRRGAVVTSTHFVCPPAKLPDLLEAVSHDDPAERWSVAHGSTEPTVLVCTQGSHDVCCGSDGARLATEIASSSGGHGDAPAVYRVSHTGGHRFAPTGMTLPDGRMWAQMDTGLVQDVFAGRGRLHADRCRGWWGAGRGIEQIAERAVYSAEEALDAAARTTAVVDADGGLVEVRTEASVWTVRVTETRAVPTISCRAEGGQPVKWSPEYAAQIVAR